MGVCETRWTKMVSYKHNNNLFIHSHLIENVILRTNSTISNVALTKNLSTNLSLCRILVDYCPD